MLTASVYLAFMGLMVLLFMTPYPKNKDVLEDNLREDLADSTL